MPNRGFIKPSSTEFGTDCDKTNSGTRANYYSYKVFEITQQASKFKPCTPFSDHESFPLASRDQFMKNLEKFGDQMQTAVGLKTAEDATSITGTTNSVTAHFRTGTGGPVEAITIYKNKIATIVEGN